MPAPRAVPPPPAPPLDPQRLESMLAGRCAAWRIENVARTGSTNADLLARFSARDAPIRARLRALQAPLRWHDACRQFPPIARVAAEQSAGRGRLGRQWRGVPGASLLFSLGVVLPGSIDALTGLGLAVGVGVVDGLRRLPLAVPERLGLKWPNDILCDDAKLGGILIETAFTTAHACVVVIGIGLNLHGDAVQAVAHAGCGTDIGGIANGGGVASAAGMANAGGTAGIADAANARDDADAARMPFAMATRPLPATSLASAFSSAFSSASSPAAHAAAAAGDDERAALSPTAVFATLLPALSDALDTFSTAGLGAFRERWWAMHRFAGRSVAIIDDGRERLSGIAVGIDAVGRLLIDTGAAGHAPAAVAAGDLSLRLLPDSRRKAP